MTSANPASPLRLGMLTPSSNTVLEPMLSRMTAERSDITVHYSRFRVTEIALSQAALGQFAFDGMVAAAELLSHARMATIAWNGTSAAWMGFRQDEELCERIEAATGIPATSSVLAFREAFRTLGLKRIGLVTPYTDDVEARIAANWEAEGFPCTADRHLGLSDNYSFAEVGESRIATMVRETAKDGCDAVAIVCTNMRGAVVAPALERELGLPVLDSISVTLWASLRLAGADPSTFGGWGCMFEAASPEGARP